MKCPKCGSKRYCKFGFNGKGEHRRQRYKCALCPYVYTVPRLSERGNRNWAYPLIMHKKAIRLFKDSKPRSYQEIAKLVGGGVTKHTVRKWIITHQLAQQLLKGGPVPAPIEKPLPTTAEPLANKSREPSKEILDKLFDLYFLDRLSKRGIAKELGVSDMTVGRWLRKYYL